MENEAEHGEFSWSYLLDAMKSPQLWMVFIMFFGNGGESHARVLGGFGWSGLHAVFGSL
jgi:hypothetical protein